MSNVKSKCPHCLRSIELRNNSFPPHLNQSGKVCEPKRQPVQTVGNYEPPPRGRFGGYKKVP